AGGLHARRPAGARTRAGPRGGARGRRLQRPRLRTLARRGRRAGALGPGPRRARGSLARSQARSLRHERSPMIAIYALCGGYLELPFESMIRDAAPSRWMVPIECFLIDHPRGRLLFDTGLHCDTLTKMRERYGEERAKRFGVHSKAGDDVVSQLARLGLK